MSTTSHRPTALITGAAKRIGARIAAHLAARGWDLVLHYHQSAAEAQTLAEQLAHAHGVRVTLRAADLSAPLDTFWQGLPACSLLVNNAAIYERDTLAELTSDRLARHLHLNLQVPLLLSHGFMAQLPSGMPGHIVVLGDGVVGGSIAPGFFSYAASKHAWVSLIDLLAAAVAPRARANLIAMPPVLPNVIEEEGLFARLAARAPLQRTSTPGEVLTALDFLLASPGVTGQVLSLANGAGLVSSPPSA